MGEEINQEQFDQQDYERFDQCLQAETARLRELFAGRAFDNHGRVLGYELELCLTDSHGNPSKTNTEVLETAANHLFTTELARFNLEINGNPFAYSEQLFSRVESDLDTLFAEAASAAKRCNAELGMFGVLPCLQAGHLDCDEYMTGLHRYDLLNQQVLNMRGQPVHLELHGEDDLVIDRNDVMLEAMATSLQIHMQCPFDETVDTYHAALWASMLLLGAVPNSPLVLGKRCWQESRIGIFKQAVDTRNPQEILDNIIPRVHFGKGYISSLLDLFEDNFYYSPILPEVIDKPVDALHHLSLHNGTIWRWVRPIVDRNKAGEYHLRLELRVVPSGPTLTDTMANTVFFVGLCEGLKTYAEDLTRVDFPSLERDFYSAARDGMQARVHWVDGARQDLKSILLQQAIPLARQGLKQAGLLDSGGWLDIIEARVNSERTGAEWILQHWQRHADGAMLVRDYLAQARQNIPVHLWSRDQA